jgi:hypothetical protein
MLDTFRNFTANRLSIDELIVLSAFGRQLRDEYEHQQVDEPDWLAMQLNSLKREIQSRMADKMEKRRSQIKAQLDNLKTPQQRKAELTKELRELETALEV